MKTKLLAIIISLFLLLSFVGCTCADSADSTTKYISYEWVLCGEIDAGLYYFNLYYDKDTKVMYAVSSNRVTVLLNADGTPKLYEESDTTYNY